MSIAKGKEKKRKRRRKTGLVKQRHIKKWSKLATNQIKAPAEGNKNAGSNEITIVTIAKSENGAEVSQNGSLLKAKVTYNLEVFNFQASTNFCQKSESFL
jgi:hypothetical protein